MSLEKILTAAKYASRRVREPSTWAGLSVLLTLFGVPAVHLDQVYQIVGAIAAVLAVVLPDTPGQGE